MLYITSYHSPDIDGIACCIGYSELLQKLGTETQTTYFGDLSKEVEFVRKYTKYFPLIKHFGKYPEDSKFILVDTADPEALEPEVSLENVVEIFDHRELVFTGKFKNAKLNIEKVGSCATLITELYKKNNLKPSQKAATYLYSAIISNTVNFKNLVTTQRDKDAAIWLKTISEVSNNYIKEMFEYKSKIENKDNLIFLIEQDFATHEMYGKNVMIAQIEIANLEKVINNYKPVLVEELEKLKKSEKLDYTLFSGIDILKGFNILVTVDEESSEIFAEVLEIPKFNKYFKTDNIIMRKQIWPKVDKFLKK